MAKLIICVMYSDGKLFEEVRKGLEESFGRIVDSVTYDFNVTSYYEEEMGKGLKKTILSFERIITENKLAKIKRYTDIIEDKYRINSKRRVNIDPGYLTEKELVLASNKKSAYKQDLGLNVYAHLTLKFENGAYVTTHRTYPDFKKEEVQKFLLKNIKK
ncbi:DUF4416 family protein [Candidatus Woesearchaeota archaeon]|nr:DUF4416 family protein [Candidatus Woesearchaeota archaeon]